MTRAQFLGGTMRSAAKETAERNLARIGALAALVFIAAVLIYAH